MGRSIITLDDLTVNNIGTFKKLLQVTLPTSYPETWYNDSFNNDQVVKLAFYSELPVGQVRGKLMNSSHNIPSFESANTSQLPSKSIPNAIYVESLSVLEAYRNLGIGSKLLEWIIEQAKEKFIHEIFLHVHAVNTTAIEWYEKKGFKKSPEVVKDYYKQQGLNEPDAVLLTLTV
ncbi:hypothetical protein FT663_00962 [Candidozyma haemuli var. vulneris]|uniref:N-acetyltransferase domain-containing protein n=1 Tax=Candidozyma haemuli TaxID=45357 RepID=A0A2V1AS03_9ASCO|nr:hypothetical protein CXQ85_001842 [[Candida] haemuloni]KAF3993138.1 hypothetical protein FT662_00766 [[Candida] haemuloni var. vulneris]KAF3994988.1 hypothetical protein FT663_00962 [[Candida] haemuloni var. vulneris]PVH20063.1 hypothetical protein CXQ85_001842 [[Candida] haemuloni]